jgi:uncharacterized NAD(P)/FAD-binding protein YdhS
MGEPVALDLICIGRGAAGIAFVHALARRGWHGRLGWIGAPETLAFHRARCEHLLNTRASTMGVDPAAPDGFRTWSQAQGVSYGPDAFAHRRRFAAYLDACADDARMHLSARARVLIANRVASLDSDGGDLVVRVDKHLWRAPVVVAAAGFGAPRDALHPAAYDPWNAPYETLAARHAAIAIIGGGLSGLDSVHSLRAAGHRGAITVLARRAHVPFAHPETPSSATPTGLVAGSVAQTLHAVRARARMLDWRCVLNSVRSQTPDWWATVPLAQKRSALRPDRLDLWSLLRHRAPLVTRAYFDAALADGALALRSGLATAIDHEAGRLRVRGPGLSILADAVIDARGPLLDLAQAPLFAPLLRAGIVARSATGIGLASDTQGMLACARGTRLFGIGAVHFGERLETTAFPEVRAQADVLAARLAATADR